MSPRVGSLFAGYGGLDMAVEEVFGGELAWYSEIDKGALKILEHRFPDVPNVGDVTTADWSQVEPIDILTGGSPCQDLSHAGKRQGMTEGTRSNLWVAMREAIAQLRPRLVVWENVRGAASAEADSDLEFCAGCMGEGRLNSGPVLRALGRVVGDLADLGYVGRVHGLQAADVDSCHGRFRYFLAAHPAGDAWWLDHGDDGATRDAAQPARRGPLREATGSAAEPGEPTGAPSLLPTPRNSDTNGPGRHGEGGVDLRTAVSLLPSPSAADGNGGGRLNSPGHQRTLPGTAKLLPTPRAGDGEKGGPNQRGSSGDHKDHTIRREPHRPDDIDTLSRALDGVPAALLPTPSVGVHLTRSGDRSNELLLPRAAKSLGGAVETPACCPAYGQSWVTSEGVDYGPAVRRWHDLTRCTPPPTEIGGKGGRRLSPAFSEWMMGLPQGWVTDAPGITRNEALKALGNGVVPQQAAAAIRTMLAWEAVA